MIWCGLVRKPANYTAKLTELGAAYPTRITNRVFNRLNDEAKFAKDGKPMWEAHTWVAMGGSSIYRSSYTWRLTELT